ncbi:uncharacterized protein VICG_01359 [Vittaforma corneae ATCC 50505]|uniref:NEDD8-activating enzyme E1 catalytic subunit n=1 Tax=Vittaforma corneae (strain ATCC 50505) TaxID=993615 RepID=L2GLA2_VITCO|nr:uncharacterized protein VICG_01359 [Vittaforma corneae ATCC 50505]ELA41611.1 hypothetical protein VICG_01359 [Vittaforma corneae ATCC 50505]
MERKILVIGCGGLGCELAKLLAMDPSNKLTFVDDDTIDSTNLNRQFLFTRTDIGKSKAQVLREKIKTGKRAEYIFGKINQFRKLEFYKQFDIVYNCLDNDETRSFVNQRCHAAGVQMVDGGSAGWLGQSFYNGKECFDCLPKRREKVYPVCTIRQRPKNFEHCLVWARTVVEGKNKEFLHEEIQAYNAIESSNEDLAKEVTPEDEAKDESIVNISSSEEIVLEDEQENSSTNLQSEHIKKVKISEDKFRFPSMHINLYERLEDETENSAALIYDIAVIRARRFSIKRMSFIDSQTFLNRIVPSICTTNSIIASLMLLSARQERNFYLVQGSLCILRRN